MAQSIDDILRELDAGYNPSRQLLQQKIDALPAQADAQISGLNATKDVAFNDILSGARDRGMGFAGIPLADQAKYTATDFLPAVAKVRQSQNDAQSSLTGALNDVNLDQRKTAYGIQSSQEANDIAAEAQRAAERARARADAAGGSGSLADLFGGSDAGLTAAPGPKSASLSQRPDKGFNFVDASGRPISAAQFSQLKGVPLRTLLQQMANAGDRGAKTALDYVGNDYNYNAQKLGSNKQVASILNSLLWGVNTAKLAATAKPAPKKAVSVYKPPLTVLNIRNPLAVKK